MEHLSGARINKILANTGFGSRRDAEALIASGEVAINGRRVTHPSERLAPGDRLSVRGRLVNETDQRRLWAFHKPDKFLVSHADPAHRRVIFDLLPDSFSRLKTVGRLDYHSEGLLLLTNDGAFARFLEHPDNAIRRTYRVRAYGRVNFQRLERLRSGIILDGQKLRPIDVRVETKKIPDYPINAWYRVVLQEGKYREIRRVFAHFGLVVSRLIRVGYGPHRLGDLPPGRWRVIR